MFKSFLRYILPLSIFLFGGISGITELSAQMNGHEDAAFAYQQLLNGNASSQQSALVFTTPSQEGIHHHIHWGLVATESEIELEEDENTTSKKYLEISDYFTAFELLSQIFAEAACTESLAYYKQFSYDLISPSIYLLIEVFIL